MHLWLCQHPYTHAHTNPLCRHMRVPKNGLGLGNIHSCFAPPVVRSLFPSPSHFVKPKESGQGGFNIPTGAVTCILRQWPGTLGLCAHCWWHREGTAVMSTALLLQPQSSFIYIVKCYVSHEAHQDTLGRATTWGHGSALGTPSRQEWLRIPAPICHCHHTSGGTGGGSSPSLPGRKGECRLPTRRAWGWERQHPATACR